MKYFQFKGLLQKGGWISPAYVGVELNGTICYLGQRPPEEAVAIEVVHGWAIPGFQNGHSHAFQYAMAGLAEQHTIGTKDDFWSWREAMYLCALSVDPDEMENIAAMLYSEMLRVGYTHVAEFHYLHHSKDGTPYTNHAEMGERLIAAAKTAGIKITLIPIFYQKGSFGQVPYPRQRRFISSTTDEYLKLLDSTGSIVKLNKHAALGFGIHSVRAVEGSEIIRTFQSGPRQIPFHLHISEQKKEVVDCLQYYQQRPLQWLFNNLKVDDRFHLVHATHLDDAEVKQLAVSGAVVVLCPSTEGNLGDGIFRMKEYVNLNGRWCIGTDSHIGLHPLEEFRMIDYRQRIITHQRNTFEGNGAQYLINEALNSGKRSMGNLTPDHFGIDQPLDAVVYSAKNPLLANSSMPNLLSTLVYSSTSSQIEGILVNGAWVIKDNIHNNYSSIFEKFSNTIRKLKNR